MDTKVAYSFQAPIGIDNGYGNDWSETVIELNKNFQVLTLYTEFLGNNAVEEGNQEDTLHSLNQIQYEKLQAAIFGFKAGLLFNRHNF